MCIRDRTRPWPAPGTGTVCLFQIPADANTHESSPLVLSVPVGAPVVACAVPTAPVPTAFLKDRTVTASSQHFVLPTTVTGRLCRTPAALAVQTSTSRRSAFSRPASFHLIPPLDTCLLYTSDAADDLLCVDLGGRRII